MQPTGLFSRTLALASVLAGASLTAYAASAGAKVDYTKEVRPILSENCYFCHGPDANHRKAGLRLDTKEDAFKELKDGGFAVVAGDPDKSKLLQRIVTHDEDDIMPPTKTGKKLTTEQVALIRNWIVQGAEWQGHWAYQTPKRSEAPEVKKKEWVRNAIDAFILARLEKEGISPSAPAHRAKLIRRLSFDLRGLPPTIAEGDAFVADTRPDAYEQLVERFLKSEQFGERMAQHWLDLARYADTNGYHIDNHRDMWKWREWVIRAFNENKPFDTFTVEQLAGDMLPNATLDQKIASGFNRNGMVNFEGGADPDEYLTKYIVDRVTTTANVWLGSTIGCAECHDHKYDPFSQKEFYQFYAFFHNVPERGLDGNVENPVPFMRLPTPEQGVKLADLVQKLPEAERVFKEREMDLPNAQAKWEKEQAPKAGDYRDPEGYLLRFALDENASVEEKSRGAATATFKGEESPAWAEGRIGKALKLSGKGGLIEAGNTANLDRHEPFSISAWVKPEGSGGVILSKIDDPAKVRGWDFGLVDGVLWVHLIHAWETNAIKVVSKDKFTGNNWRHVAFTYDGSSKAAGIKLFVDGKAVAANIDKDALTDTIQSGAALHIGKRKDSFPFNGAIDDVRIYLRTLKDEECRNLAVRPIYDTILLASDQRGGEQKKELARYFRENFASDLKGAESRLNALRKEKDDLFKEIPVTMVMEEMPNPRKTHVLVRGNFQQKGEEVQPALPAIFGIPAEQMPTNRLTLAKWLVQPDHPLTARVTVNRFWAMIFGSGLVRTANDFGSQGEFPSHPELLDWLASEFVASKWDVKHIIRLMVTSAAYQQDSSVTPERLEKDAYNRLLARGPRFRLDAEFIRDNALAVSGLLNPVIGGKSVFPYQPPGLWEEVSFGAGFSSQNYVQSKGEDLYRRGLYTYWKRSIHYPSFATFDAPNREICTAQRPRTTTPLQALVLMNDPVYVEAARALASRTLKEGGDSTRSKLVYAFRLTLGRTPKDQEVAVLEKTLLQQRENFQKDTKAAEELLNVGESPKPTGIDPVELASWTALSSVLLNLDETITKI